MKKNRTSDYYIFRTLTFPNFLMLDKTAALNFSETPVSFTKSVSPRLTRYMSVRLGRSVASSPTSSTPTAKKRLGIQYMPVYLLKKVMSNLRHQSQRRT